MRIVSRRELMAMEPGVLYAELFGDGQYGELCIYGGSSGNDFTERCIINPESGSSEELWQRQDDMLANGTSYPVEAHYGRDGMFDDDARYLVYDAADIVSIVQDLRPYRDRRGA